MNLRMYKIARFLRFFPVKTLSSVTGQHVILPYYHLISNSASVHVKHLYRVRNTLEFAKDLDFLLKHFVPIDANELLKSIDTGKKIKKNSFMLSFDDGLREFCDVVAPILLKKGIPATCFLNSGFIDNKDLFFRYKASILIEMLLKHDSPETLRQRIRFWAEQKNIPYDEEGNFMLNINYLNKHYLDEIAAIMEVDFSAYLKLHKPYLTSDQIIRLMKDGFTFGAHSIDHPRYHDLSVAEQVHQTLFSMEKVRQNFSIDHGFFSFPFTDYKVPVLFFNTVLNTSNKLVDLTFGSAGLKKDSIKRNIQRIPMEIQDFSAQDILYGEYIYFLCKALVNKNIIKR